MIALKAMFIDKINLNHLRVFECVFRTRSMTAAADELHLTQSGVSQHIKTLEDSLDVKLFDRVNQKLIPTNEGKSLFEICTPVLNQIEHGLQELRGETAELSGTVSIGMPMEFGHNMIMPLISEIAKKNPGIKFRIRFGFAEEMNSLILIGDVDFAFVDAFAFDRRVTTETVFEETLELCVNKETTLPIMKDPKKFFESLDYVEYQEDAPVLRMWLEHHYAIKNVTLNIRARVPSVLGIALFIISGAGAGILPDHKIQRLQNDGHKLVKIKSGKTPLKNSINIAYLGQRTISPVSLKVRQLLVDSLKA